MKITFIKPNIGRLGHSLYTDEGRMEPLSLGVLAGLTPPDIDVALYMAYYPHLKVEKNLRQDGTKIYTITERDTGNLFQFASRSYAWQPGY